MVSNYDDLEISGQNGPPQVRCSNEMISIIKHVWNISDFNLNMFTFFWCVAKLLYKEQMSGRTSIIHTWSPSPTFISFQEVIDVTNTYSMGIILCSDVLWLFGVTVLTKYTSLTQTHPAWVEQNPVKQFCLSWSSNTLTFCFCRNPNQQTCQ